MDNHNFALAAFGAALAAPEAPAFDQLAFIMAYEAGELDAEEVRDGFAHLIRSGLCWQLQGHYGRTANAFIRGGFLTSDGQPGPRYDELES